MDTSDPEISFDERGRCNHCRNYEIRVASEVFRGEEGKRRLDALLQRVRARGRGRDYDCIIGVSGGVDSTMVAYTVRELGLRPLAVHFDNGWDSELAVDNIKKTLDRLGIDLQTHVVDWEEFRDLQLSFLKASVANCEIPTDHAITALLFNAAARHGIRYIFGGGNVATEGILPFSWGYYNWDRKHLEAIHRRFGTVPLKTTPRISLSRFVYLVFARGIRLIPILNYVDYNKTEAMKLIQEKLCWRYYGGKHYESIYTRFFQGYILPVKFGFDKRRAHLATLVCSGEMSREDALREMEKDPYGNANLLREDREFVIKKFGLTEDAFAELMERPVRSYRDYPNHSFLFHTLRDMRSRFKKVATAA
jgi:N-acetyl sugar amidotransferase